ncbi:MAG: carbohydrate binding family 9 domain-containing protein [Gemmatimonadaceae bacterium]
MSSHCADFSATIVAIALSQPCLLRKGSSDAVPVVVALTAVAFVSPPQEVASVTKRTARADVKAAFSTATAVRAPRAPAIDGRNDDESWRAAPSFSKFRQFEPKVDVDPTFKTEFQVAYDPHFLYVFVRMYDSHPDSIMHALSRRDVRGESDQIKLLIDSYGDKRSGFEFAVNPDGVKRDFAISNDGQEDDSWHGIWDVATRVDSLGWTAECRIPISQLRDSSAAAHTFGVGVWRDIERFKERT